MALTKEEILAQTNLAVEELDIPEWGGTVWVRELTAAKRDGYEASLLVAKRVKGRMQMEPALANAKAKMVVKCLVDADGNRLFQDTDINALGQLSSAALNRIVETAQRLSGMSEEDLEELGANFDNGQSENLSSD